jgi:hypothetical protein
VTHEYTILTGGLVLPGGGAPACTAIAWADEIVLGFGPDHDVRAMSRGDSRFIDLRGAAVVPLGAEDSVRWPPEAALEIGGRADLAVLDGDPRDVRAGGLDGGTGLPRTLALIRGGRVVLGVLPGGTAVDHDDEDPRPPTG